MSGGEETAERAQPRGRIRWWIAGALFLLLFGLVLVWTQRKPIAQGFVARALAERQVRAHYDLVEIGPRTQRIENLVLGDPARPDLTARIVEIDLGYGLGVPHVAAVRASGVRMHGDARGGALKLGELDKFRDPASTAPLSLPDIHITLQDARARIETDAGPAGIVLSGRGNLRSGFSGQLAALMRDATLGGCTVPRLSLFAKLRMADGAPRLDGPLRADAMGCPASGFALSDAVAMLDVRGNSALDRWTGTIRAQGQAVRQGMMTLAGPSAQIRFEGGTKGGQGEARLGFAALRANGGRTGAGEMRVSGALSANGAVAAQGQARIVDLAGFDAGALRGAGASTPVEPLIRRLADALAAAQQGNVARAQFSVRQQAGKGEAWLTALDISSRSGAHIALSPEGRFAYGWPTGRWSLAGSITSTGGGLPDAALRLAPRADGAVSGQLFMDDYTAGNARLGLEPVRFVAAPGGRTRIFTTVYLDGPLPGNGRLSGLALPVEGDLRANGDLMLNPVCTSLRVRALETSGLALRQTVLRLCPESGALLALRGGRMSGGGVVRGLKLEGSMGQNALRLSAAAARFSLGQPGFRLDGPELLIGSGESRIRLAAAQMDGRAAARGLGGELAGVEAKIGVVPLLVKDGTARWGFAEGALAMRGAITLYDAATPDRFNPLLSRDFALKMASGRIDASGSFLVPRTLAPVGMVTVSHQLGPGRGEARLSVRGLRFDENTQPEDVTRLALGVVANVRGLVTGTGTVRWQGGQVTSEGEFGTDNMALAAAFGPVTGLSTRLRFTDLIGLATAPGQVATLGYVNPGIAVENGELRYQLLPGQRVAVEGGRWPFSGGELTLLPTVMDFSAEKPRNLSFRVVGLDAGKFIQTLELENVSATGTFDGLLPMVFDASGGRIVGGILVARQEGLPPRIIPEAGELDIPCDPARAGGTLAYVGQVSNENVGRMGRLAFDALKDLQYKCLTVLMDGAIDGEVVTQVAFNGVNRGELSTVPKPIARQFIGLPFIFNVKIAAPFRGLMNTARSFIDPSFLIRSHLGDGFETVKQNRLAVQPRESDNTVSGETQ